MGGHAVGIGEMHRAIGTVPNGVTCPTNNVLKSLVRYQRALKLSNMFDLLIIYIKRNDNHLFNK